jgi:hypothetical protein
MSSDRVLDEMVLFDRILAAERDIADLSNQVTSLRAQIAQAREQKREAAKGLVEALDVVSQWPITQPATIDSFNMQKVAEAALATYREKSGEKV